MLHSTQHSLFDIWHLSTAGSTECQQPHSFDEAEACTVYDTNYTFQQLLLKSLGLEMLLRLLLRLGSAMYSRNGFSHKNAGRVFWRGMAIQVFYTKDRHSTDQSAPMGCEQLPHTLINSASPC
jgi:hypothetical protein